MFSNFKKEKYLIIVATITIGFFSGHWATIKNNDTTTKKNRESVEPFSNNKRAPKFNYYKVNSSSKNSNLNKALDSSEKGRELARIIAKLIKGETPQNWEKELFKIIEYSRGNEGRKDALLIFFSKWAEADFQSAFERSGQIPMYVHDIRNEIFSQLAEQDPKKAFFFYEKNEASSLAYATTVLGDIAENWAKLNPEEAFEWCSSSVKKYKIHSFVHFMQGLDWDPVKTKEYMGKIRDRSGKVHRVLIEEWSKADPNSAKEWTDTNVEI